MTKQEINREIAKCCGWTEHYEKGEGFDGWWNPEGKFRLPDEAPNYYEDLNACAKMEEILAGSDDDDDFREQYQNELWKIIHKEQSMSWVIAPPELQRMMSATAPQRCEAFLRMKGKWKD